MQNEAYMKHIQLILEKVSNSHAHITDNFRFDRNLCKGGSGVEWGWDLAVALGEERQLSEGRSIDAYYVLPLWSPWGRRGS